MAEDFRGAARCSHDLRRCDLGICQAGAAAEDGVSTSRIWALIALNSSTATVTIHPKNANVGNQNGTMPFQANGPLRVRYATEPPSITTAVHAVKYPSQRGYGECTTEFGTRQITLSATHRKMKYWSVVMNVSRPR